MVKIVRIIFAILIAVSLVDLTLAISSVPAQEWADYKAKFNKNYTNSDMKESYAKGFYVYNKFLINLHNAQYERGIKRYKLAINQFSDMRFMHFKALFPVATSSEPHFDSPPPLVQGALPSYDPINDFGFTSKIENQGTKCNSGWAFAAAKSIELLQAQQTANMSPASLSAQNFIDCAGRSSACKNQVPEAAFVYLTQYNMGLHLESDYNNNNILQGQQGMCAPHGELVTNLANFSRLPDGDYESLKAYISNGFPVVVECTLNSFDFMHYSKGVFEPPATYSGSHFMLAIGYGTDTITGLDYWLLQNSFGTTWGEMGFMKLLRSPTNNPIKNAIFPTELA